MERDRRASHHGENDLGVEARWQSNVDRSPRPKGCWLWNGRHDRFGYARMEYQNRNASAMRIGFMLVTGYELQRNEVMHYGCGNRGCVNPEHFEFPTHKNAPKLATKAGLAMRARRDRRIVREVEAALPQNLPEEVRNEMRQELALATLRGGKQAGKANRMQVTQLKAKRALAAAWLGAYGDPLELSIDVPIGNDDGDEITFADRMLDSSIFSDPVAILEISRRGGWEP